MCHVLHVVMCHMPACSHVLNVQCALFPQLSCVPCAHSYPVCSVPPQVSGIKFSFDPTQPPSHRVVPGSVFVGEKEEFEPLDLAKSYKVATKEYLAMGKDGYDVFLVSHAIPHTTGQPSSAPHICTTHLYHTYICTAHLYHTFVPHVPYICTTHLQYLAVVFTAHLHAQPTAQPVHHAPPHPALPLHDLCPLPCPAPACPLLACGVQQCPALRCPDLSCPPLPCAEMPGAGGCREWRGHPYSHPQPPGEAGGKQADAGRKLRSGRQAPCDAASPMTQSCGSSASHLTSVSVRTA